MTQVHDHHHSLPNQTVMPPSKWTPAPGQLATYTGRTGSSRRNMMVLAEAVGGRFVVEAIGKTGVIVRLTVKRKSLAQPQPDLFG